MFIWFLNYLISANKCRGFHFWLLLSCFFQNILLCDGSQIIKRDLVLRICKCHSVSMWSQIQHASALWKPPSAQKHAIHGSMRKSPLCSSLLSRISKGAVLCFSPYSWCMIWLCWQKYGKRFPVILKWRFCKNLMRILSCFWRAIFIDLVKRIKHVLIQ